MPHIESGPKCASRIASGRLHPNLSEWRVQRHLAIGDRVGATATSDAKIVDRMPAMHRIQKIEKYLFVEGLGGAGDVAMML
jgi:hypothetical protein